MVVLLIVLGIYAVLWIAGRIGDAAANAAARPLRRASRALREADVRAGAVGRYPRAAGFVGVLFLVVVIIAFATSGAAIGVVLLVLGLLLTGNAYLGGDFDDSGAVALRRMWRAFAAPASQPTSDQQLSRPASNNPSTETTAPTWSLGVMISSRSVAGGGLRVSSVVPAAPAEKAGMAAGDVLRSADGIALSNYESLRSVLRAHRVGQPMPLEWQRGMQTMTGIAPDDRPTGAAAESATETGSAGTTGNATAAMPSQGVTKPLLTKQTPPAQDPGLANRL